MNSKLSILILTFWLYSTLANSSNIDLEQALNTVSKPMHPGYSVHLTHKGQTLFHQALGMASIELKVPLQTKHVFEIGSLTKQFTAIAVLHLAQNEQLSLDDNINQYISGITSKNLLVTLRHLLAHTSGLEDPINSNEFLSSRIQESIELNDLVNQFKNDHWQYPVGERVVYSNVGYSMLAYVIEKVSQLSYQQYLSKHIFQPLNMKQTSQASFAVTPNKVSGYTYNGDIPQQHGLINLNWAYGAADLLSSTSDMAKFHQGLMQNKILSNEYLSVLFNPVILSDGTHVGGTFNASLSKIGKYNSLTMNGSTMGYSSHSVYVPEKDMYLIVLSNSDGINGGGWVSPQNVAIRLLSVWFKAD